MADENILPRDQNHVTAAGFESSTTVGDVRPGQIIVATGRIKVDLAGGGGGDVVGPGSSTDNAVARWDGVTGELLQDSVVIISDLGAITGVTTIVASGAIRSNTSLILEETGAGTDIITIQAPASIAASYTLTLPIDDGSNLQFLQTDGNGVLSWASPAGSGDVVGPASATDGVPALFDGTTGKLIKNSTPTGTGNPVMQTTPTLITPVIGVATGTSLTLTGILVSGVNGATGGSLKLFGATSGDVTLKVAAAAGTATIFQLPATNGSSTNILQTDGAGVTSWVAKPAGTVTSVSGTTDRITSTGGATPVIDIAATYAGQTSITILGTIATGTWNATVIAGQYGGTGVANTGKTITIGGSITFSGAFTFTGTVTANTTVTFPTSGTLYGTLAGSITSAQLATSLSDETGTGVVVFNAKPTFVGTVQTIVAVAALALDGSLGSYFTKTIATGSTFTQSNFTTGQMFTLKITGAFTPTWFSGITWLTVGGTAPVQGAITTYGFVCTGSNTFDGYLVGTQ